MNYLSVENISKSFGIRTLFSNVSFHINEGDQIALVAKNGSGKTTLLKILSGMESPDSGKVIFNKDIKVVMFEQSETFNQDVTAEEYIFTHSNPVLDIVHQYDTMVQNAPTHPELLSLIEKMDQWDGWKVEPIIQEIITKLKIDFLDQKIKNLSGGQQKRISLAKFLIDISFEKGTVLLILDEPTNHLDIEMVEWLEFFLNKENKTLILVTHDRYFLDAICTRILELEGGTLYSHNGDYETYVTNKSSRIENQIAQTDKAKNLYRKELEWMRRQPQARTSKSKSRIESFYKTEEIAKKSTSDAQVQLDMQMTRLGKKVIEMEHVFKYFGNKIILDNFSHTFARGSKIGIIGKNGVGKTTFLKILEKKEEFDSGTIEWGETLQIGHFKQEGLSFNEDQRVIDFVKEIADYFPLSNGKQITAGQFLEMFLFSPEAQYTYISKLSGGEKKRLQLLSILFRNPNFLILDEPTNDLDLPTLTVLENFLDEYQGCLLIVSHDRYFMDKVVDELMIFEGNGKISWFIGNYTDYYLKSKEKEIVPTKDVSKKEIKNINPTVVNKVPKLSFKEKRELEKLEKEIPQLEEEKIKLTEKLSSSSLSFDEIQEISNKLENLIKSLDLKESRWLELSELKS
ncbi:ATP-binding cassette, subfamily F, uup [Apibacter mensalis]|uniref:ATP-binding cassette, subfamily F, uup n=1 Tax=Apibacter mensalis TaxID=1586267 RepID=A0A0X3ALZ7_9FLAO|nr:ABC-F family ATP-binding cassette domain-containing protein [Apibacter mensalis]CVK15354.1 ATP-binding cassette, subfamily F, uup [Apibacter mensalis]